MAAELTVHGGPRASVDLPPQSAALRHPVARLVVPLLALGGAVLLLQPAVRPADTIGAALPGGRVLLVVAGTLMLLVASPAARHHPSPVFPWGMIGCGALCWAPVLLGTTDPVLFTIGVSAQHLAGASLFLAALQAPYNKFGSPGIRLIFGLAVAASLVAGLGIALGAEPSVLGCTACPHTTNLLADVPPIAPVGVLRWVATSLMLAAATPAVVVLWRRWRGVPYGSMSTIIGLFVLMPAWAAAFIVIQVTFPDAAEAPTQAHVVATVVTELALLGVAGVSVKLVGGMLLRGIQAASFIAELQGTAPEDLEAVLRRGLRDPGLRLGYAGDGTTWRDPHGTPVVVPPVTDPVVTGTPLVRGDRVLGVVVHSRTLGDDAEVLRAVLAAVALTLENQELTAEAERRLAEAQASRLRIVAAADAARRRVERDLHDGAQARLLAAALELRILEARHPLEPEAQTALQLLEAAVVEIRDLGRGLYPAALADGLGPAVGALIQLSTANAKLTTRVDDRRYPEPVEQCAYFVVAEALTNATKHAHASNLEVTLGEDDHHLVVTVADDGVGGADLAGAGLLGLLDRVSAVDGRLEIHSPPGGGTRVSVRLPVSVPLLRQDQVEEPTDAES